MTCPYYGKKLEKIGELYIYHVLYSLHGMCMTTYDTGGRTLLCSIPPVRSISLCHV